MSAPSRQPTSTPSSLSSPSPPLPSRPGPPPASQLSCKALQNGPTAQWLPAVRETTTWGPCRPKGPLKVKALRCCRAVSLDVSAPHRTH